MKNLKNYQEIKTNGNLRNNDSHTNPLHNMVLSKMNIYSVYDAKADAYLLPFFFKKDEMAIRVFGDLINQEDHQFCKHPADFTLFAIGTFEETTGEIADILAGSLGNGVEFINSTPIGEQYGPQFQPKPNG